MSKRYTLNKEDGKKILQVFLWTMASAAIGFLIAQIPAIDIPPQYAAVMGLIIPLVNNGLVMLKKFIDDKIE